MSIVVKLFCCELACGSMAKPKPMLKHTLQYVLGLIGLKWLVIIGFVYKTCCPTFWIAPMYLLHVYKLSSWLSKHGFLSVNLRKRWRHVVCSLGSVPQFQFCKLLSAVCSSTNYQHPQNVAQSITSGIRVNVLSL